MSRWFVSDFSHLSYLSDLRLNFTPNLPDH
jgi:hypothetical protein